MSGSYFRETETDWSRIPSLRTLESHMYAVLGIHESEVMPAVHPKEYPSFPIGPTDYVLHKKTTTEQLIGVYENNGFETRLIMQDPFGHVGPTVACPIGFPFNLPHPYLQLRKFNRWICRVHVDVATLKNDLISVPHIEPDPRFHKLAHIWDTYIKKHVVRGEEAVEILNFLGIL